MGNGDKVTLSGGSVLSYVGATFVSISGGTLGVSSVTTANAGQTLVANLTGSASTSNTVTLVVGNIINPGAAGTSANYILETESTGVTGHSTIAGNTFTAANVPTVSHTIPSLPLVLQEDGAFTVDLEAGAGVQTDLNYTFAGDPPLTFSIDSNTNPMAATVIVTSDTLLLTSQGTGSTTITVKATDPSNAFITTSFDVTVLGSLAPASVTPSNLFTGISASYTLTLSPNKTLTTGDRIRFSTLTGVDQTSSALALLSGGTIAGSKVAGNISETVIGIDSGSVTAGTLITLELSGIQNPTMAGMSADYRIYTDDGMSVNNTGLSTVSGHVFTMPSINIFANGFEDTVVVKAAKNTTALINKLSSMQNGVTGLSTDLAYYQFMGESLAVKNQTNVRSMDEVMQWYHQVLIEKAPMGDFDHDGITNEFDFDPFGITFR